jgi:hypothetical protein
MGYSIKNAKGKPEAKDDCLDARFFNIHELPPIAFKSHRTILENALKQKDLTLNNG